MSKWKTIKKDKKIRLSQAFFKSFEMIKGEYAKPMFLLLNSTTHLRHCSYH
jgi:hypothetical protein